MPVWLLAGVTRLTDRHWLPMAEQAVVVIYKLAEHPDVICGNILKQIAALVIAQREQGTQETEQTQGRHQLVVELCY